MEGCKVLNKRDFTKLLVVLCNDSALKGLALGSIYFQDEVKKMLEIAKSSPEPEQQVQLLSEAIDEIHAASSSRYGKYLNRIFPPGTKLLLFNPNRIEEPVKTVSSTFEETAKAGQQLRLRNFLEARFKNAPNAKLYFKRSIKNDMVETFLVERSGENPRYFTSQEDMNLNVRSYKQKLVDRIFDYFNNDPMLRSLVATLPRTMYDKEGNYTGLVEQIKAVLDTHLSPKAFEYSGIKQLEDYYLDYRDKKSIQDKRFLDAYNAWITLKDFDTIVKDTIGTVIKITENGANQHVHDLKKYEISGRATNMWRNWTASDDITDMAEVISDVTQMLIDTSRMYQWGNDEAYPDRYLSFNDFNYTIGNLIKKLPFDVSKKDIVLNSDNVADLDKLSVHTKKILLEILSWNRVNGNLQRDANGDLTNLPKEVTFKLLISRLNENPQRYLHAIFDILCNTDIIKNFSFNDYEKNLIWSFNKEVFGGENDKRSLYRLHTTSEKDNVYSILTQVAASTFPEDYLQYYEKADGSISTRLLQGYALDRIKAEIFGNIKLNSKTISLDLFKEYGIRKREITNGDKKYLLETKIAIPVEDGLTLHIDTSISSVEVYLSDKDLKKLPENASKIWNNAKVLKLFRDVIGINFNADPDFKNAYIETVKSEYGAILDLGKIVGRVLFTTAVNNFYVPKVTGEGSTAIIRKFIEELYKDKAASYEKGLDVQKRIPVLPVDARDSLVGNLAMAKAINSNLLAQAQSKTGEGTALANYSLSRMRNFYLNLLEMQCRKGTSALRDLSFVVNTNGLFEGILSRRELKTRNSNQQSTKFSDADSYALSFVNDFIAGFVPNPDDKAFIKNGRVSFLPMVPSDKVQIDSLPVNLRANSKISNGRGGFKTYMELTDAEIELEMINEFKPMYERIISNINTELTKVYDLLPIKSKVTNTKSVITKNQQLLDAINNAFKDDESLGKKPKERITNGLHNLLLNYNKTHSRNPIMLSPHVHYVFDKKTGLLTSNKTLESLWGRFNPDMDMNTRNRLTALYKDEKDYQAYLSRNGLTDPLSTNSFFKYKEHLTIQNLLRMGFKVPVFGSDDKIRHDLPEIQFLRGQANLNAEQLKNPDFAHIVALNNEMKNWVDYETGYIILAKGDINGKRVNITTAEQLNQATNLQIHPMISKLNRLDYLCSQQYTIATVGSHYAHKGGAGAGSVLVEEAQRWLASNKRNVAATSTVHLFLNKLLNGSPSVYNVGIIEDIRFDLYNVMGDLYLEGHAPLDGGMFVNGWVSDLENNSLAGEAAGWDKKQFGTFFSELYGAGGIVKTAGFAASNARMRRSASWRNLQKAMTNRPWVKEFADANGNDIPEILDITKDYFGKEIDYKAAIGGKKIMYKRPAHDNQLELAAYRLDHIESLGNNQYRIYEVEIDQNGNDISSPITRDVFINTNWNLFTEVFGGYNSLDIDENTGKLTWSENSIKLMVHALNNVGYRKDNSRIKEEDYGQYGDDLQERLNESESLTTGLDLDDIWLPLKYSDIHYTPNIGAIKSLQYNVNPDGEAVLEGRAELNHFTMRLAQLGIQLDKEHHADAAEVSMPTQIILACSNRSFTSEYAREIYTSLATLTRQEIQPFLDGIQGIITSDDPSKLVESVTNLIVDNLLHQSGEDSSANAILALLLQKAESGKELKYEEDIKGKVPWSNPTISAKLFSSLSTTLTNLAVKMKFDGTLSVICPTDGIEKFHGDRMLNAFTEVFDKNGNTRTGLAEANLEAYLKSVEDGNEVDADGRNMLVFDINRDVSKVLPEEDIKRFKLSKISELKTQHNYIVEFNDGHKEEITINTPNAYYRIKNLILNGKKSDLNIEGSYIPVRKVYENVKKGRSLAAYNVRYTDKNTGYRFLIFDLDSINLLFNLNDLSAKNFSKLTPIQLQLILNKLFNSKIFGSKNLVYLRLREQFGDNFPRLDENFITNLTALYPNKVNEIVEQLRKIVRPYIYNKMQDDLFKLSPNYSKPDRQVYANGELIDPVDIKSDAYELIMPKIYQTLFGLLEFDDLQEILRDKDFFIKRGLSRYKCKLAHTDYDYELKNFNGEHVYVLDKSKGIPEHIAQSVMTIHTDKKGKKLYRVDSDNNPIYELSSDKDAVCNVNGVLVIVTDNPLFYVLTLNYNTLKVSPKRVTEESYLNLIGTLQNSKRANSQNFLKAISTPDGNYFDLNTFKQFNKQIDSLTYENIQLDSSDTAQFKSITLICKIILLNGRELHTAFNESLNLIAARIPAQSQQSFMTQRVIAFDNSNVNTAMVSTFQLFLQGSDLDIDAVTLLGYQFDKNGKFVGWSPYFKTDSKENLEASKLMPLPTGEVKDIYALFDAKDNFFETYDKYFGTLFKLIPLGDGKNKTNRKTGTNELLVDTSTPENLRLFAEFLREFNRTGINIKAPVMDDLIYVNPKKNPDFFKAPSKIIDGKEIPSAWNLFTSEAQGGLGIKPAQAYEIAQWLLKVANDHNNYLNTADEHLKAKMAKNYIVNYIYKVSESACNLTEGMESIDVSTKEGKEVAGGSELATMANGHAPGGAETKHMMIGENQAGKAGVGIGAVGIKANSTTLFYIAELLNHGSDWDREKILFRTPVIINGKVYRGFSNMFTSKEFTDEERLKFLLAFEFMDSLTSESQITTNVATKIGAYLSLAVDNAKELALAKINAGPKLMGLHIYGTTLGMSTTELYEIMTSKEGKILKEMLEGSLFNNDSTAFKVLDAFDKLNGEISGDLNQFVYTAKDANKASVNVAYTALVETKTVIARNTKDVLWALMYDTYKLWYAENRTKLPRTKSQTIPSIATSPGTMIKLLIQMGSFSYVYDLAMHRNSKKFNTFKSNLLRMSSLDSYHNWNAAFNGMINYIKDIESKSLLFKYGKYGRDLRTLAEGAEEMRILGSILSINKGLKASVADAETFIDTIENLIYNRKLIRGDKVSEADKIDFHRFMTDEAYQKEVVDAYEAVKHSVNIPHLLIKAPHFLGYLKTQMIPTSSWMTMSVMYRTLHKYRKNAYADASGDTRVSLFSMFGVDGKKDKENILRGLENLINYKLFTRWSYDNKLTFKIPKGFQYFDVRGHETTASEELTIPLYTDAGLATFKKYMEEKFIPSLKESSVYNTTNEFVKNLTKIAYDKTPLHNEVITYSLYGDLMARLGRQAELNAKMFADFLQLAGVTFLDNMSIADAFFIYSLYCYMGKKGLKSLMALFDSANSRSALCLSFDKHISNMDDNGNISCSPEELLIWCAPIGNQHSKATFAYVSDPDEAGISLKRKVLDNVFMTDELREAAENQEYELGDAEEEGRRRVRPKKFGIYKLEYLYSFYDLSTREHFLVPTTNEKVGFETSMPITLYGVLDYARLNIKQDMITDITLPDLLLKIVQAKITNGDITKFSTVSDFVSSLKNTLKSIHVPYKVSLYTDTKRDVDFGILQTIIEQQINC